MQPCSLFINIDMTIMRVWVFYPKKEKKKKRKKRIWVGKMQQPLTPWQNKTRGKNKTKKKKRKQNTDSTSQRGAQLEIEADTKTDRRRKVKEKSRIQKIAEKEPIEGERVRRMESGGNGKGGDLRWWRRFREQKVRDSPESQHTHRDESIGASESFIQGTRVGAKAE